MSCKNREATVVAGIRRGVKEPHTTEHQNGRVEMIAGKRKKKKNLTEKVW